MENIYQSWTKFNKIQNQLFKGGMANQWLELAEGNTKKWRSPAYPKGENWKYVTYKDLPTTDLKWPSLDSSTQLVPNSEFICIEVKNFCSPQKLGPANLPKGLSIYSELEDLEGSSRTTAFLDKKDNPFFQSSLSFLGLGLVVEIDENCRLDRPIKLIFNLDQLEGKDLYAHQNVRLQCHPHSRAQIFFEVRGEGFSGLSNICVETHVGAFSELELFSKELGGAQSHCVFNLNARVAERGHFKSFDFTFPSLWSRHNLEVNLLEEGACVDMLGSYFNDAKNFCDHHTAINHLVGKTESNEDYRGILTDSAQAVFNGRVFIAKKAAKSNSTQINKNLMLSNTAEIDAKPELQIYNDDVKATHGATVGQIDEEQRFYLQSRGYSASDAAQVLAKAFIFDLIEDQGPRVKKFYKKDVDNVLSRLKEN